MNQRFPRRQEQIEHDRDQHQDKDRFQTLRHEFQRDPGQADHGKQKDRRDHIPADGAEGEQRYDKNDGAEKLHPRVQFMDDGFPGIILAQCNVF